MRGPESNYHLIPVIAEKDLPAGEVVKSVTAPDDGDYLKVTDYAAADDHRPLGVLPYAIKSGRRGMCIIRGITRPNKVCGMAIPYGKGIGVLNNKLGVAGTSGASTAFAVNIGGPLANNDACGLVYIQGLEAFS